MTDFYAVKKMLEAEMTQMKVAARFKWNEFTPGKSEDALTIHAFFNFIFLLLGFNKRKQTV